MLNHSHLKQEFQDCPWVKCDACDEPLVLPKVYACGHTVCQLCSLSRNYHCPACDEVAYDCYPSNTLELMLKNSFVDYDASVLGHLEECDKYQSCKDYRCSVRFAALSEYVHDLLIDVSDLETVIEKVTSVGYSDDEARFALAIAHREGYFGYVDGVIVPKGTITDYLEDMWDDLDETQQFYLYTVSTSTNKPNWYDFASRIIETVEWGDHWVFDDEMTIDAREIDMDEVPYHHDPVNEDYGYETVSEWDDEEGFTDEEDLDDEDDDETVEGSDDENDEAEDDDYDTESVATVEGSDDEDDDETVEGSDSDDDETVDPESEIRPPTPPVPRRPKLQRNPRDLSEVLGQTLDQLLGFTSGPHRPTPQRPAQPPAQPPTD